MADSHLFNKRCLFFFLMFVMLSSCAERKDRGGGQPQGPLPGVAAPQGFQFPHPENTADPGIHGIWVNEAGVSFCLGCHKIDADPNTTIPFCRSCHTLYTHEENWVSKEKHGAYVVANGKGDCETRCHGADLGGGLSRVSCLKCHAVYPHSRDWPTPNVHGAEAEGDKKTICRPCHGDDYQGGSSGKSCFACHLNYPHGENWALKENHGAVVLRDDERVCATECHGADFGGGLSDVACRTCHGMFPHLEGWSDITGHGEAALGDGKIACVSCHGADFRGGQSGVSCFRCHEIYPHAPEWISRDAHGAHVLNFGKGVCATECHGADYGGGNSGVACGVCHEYPHMDPQWARGADPPVHARTFRQKMIDRTPNDCTVCHGTNFDRALGNGQCTNAACHGAGFGHPAGAGDNWNTGEGHGRFLTSGGFRATDTGMACFACHGESIVFQQSHTSVPLGDPNKVSAEREFLRRESTCYQCHWAYPHIGWTASGMSFGWEREIVCQQEHPGVAHREYAQQSPLMIDETGRSMLPTDPRTTQSAVLNFTCGREDGFCHFGGARSPRFGSGGLCAVLCHHADTLLPPSLLPDCEPPAEMQLPAAPWVTGVTLPGSVPGGVPINVPIDMRSVEVQFIEPMRRGTILAPGAFYLQRDSDSLRLAATPSCSEDWCMTAGLSDFGALDVGGQYSVHATSAIQDWRGASLADFQSTFTAVSLRPRVSSVRPTGTIFRPTPERTPIRVTFAWDVAPFSRALTCPAGVQCITLKRVWDNFTYSGSIVCVGNRCTLTPSVTLTSACGDDLEAEPPCPEEYEATATTDIIDSSGYNLAAPYTWRFNFAEGRPR